MEKKQLIKKTEKQLTRSQTENFGNSYNVTINGKKFIVFPNVFSPKYFSDAGFFSKHIPFVQNGSFLEIGCGTGVVAIFAGLKGVKKVVATDINPFAVLNTQENISLYGLGSVVKVKKGHLFQPVKSQKFDQIFWNAPFLYSEQENMSLLQKSTFDYKDMSKINFIKDAKKYLKKNGMLYIGYSSNYGDMKKIFNILNQNNFSVKIIARDIISFMDGTINLELIEATPCL